MNNSTKILKLSKQLLPTGRAYWCVENSNFDKILTAIANQQSQMMDDCDSLFNMLIPDNDNFLESDCLRWEKILGIYSTENYTLEQRKASIYQKMAFPSNVKGRCSKIYLQYQLRLAFGDEITIFEYNEWQSKITQTQHSLNTQHSLATVHGGLVLPEFTEYVMNCITQGDEMPLIETLDNCKRCFYIANSDFSFIAITSDRLIEFRNLVMRIKPLMTVALMRIGTTAEKWILDDGTWNGSGYWFGTSIWKTV